jgi:hypothetical protein
MNRTDFFAKVTVDGVEERDFLQNPMATFPMKYEPLYYRVNSADIMRPWIISLKCYGLVDFWWLLMFLNNIDNPFTDIVEGMILTVPNRIDIIDFAKRFRVV